jgi:hypothetical protein
VEGDADRKRCLLNPPDEREELSGWVEARGGGVAPGGVGRLAVDEAFEQVSGRATALRSEPGRASSRR